MFLRGAVDSRQWLQSPSKLENYVHSSLYNLCKKNSKIIKSGKENPLQKRIPTKLELNRLDSKKQNCCASGGPLCISNQSPSRHHYTNEFRPCLDHEITCGKIKDITITSHNRLTIYIYEYIHTTWREKKNYGGFLFHIYANVGPQKSRIEILWVNPCPKSVSSIKKCKIVSKFISTVISFGIPLIFFP